MAEKLCQLKKKGGAYNGVDVSAATLGISTQRGTSGSNAFAGDCTAQIDAGDVAVVSVWQHAQLAGSNPIIGVSVSITGTQNVDYEIIFDDTTSRVVVGQVAVAQAFRGMVVKAINNITITASHQGGQNYPSGGILIYDLS